MKKQKKEFIRNIVILAVLTLVNVFLILNATLPQLQSLKEGINLLVCFIYFGVEVLYLAVINVDIIISKKTKRYSIIPIMSGIVFVLGICMIILI